MILQKKFSAKSFSCNHAKLQRAASTLQQKLGEKPELVTAIIDAVMRHKKSFYQLQGLRNQDMGALYATAYDCYVVLYKISQSLRQQKPDQYLFSCYQEKKAQQKNW